MRSGVRLAVAARALAGSPFRLHGRDPVTGLDCIGVVAAALERIGRPVTLPANYRLRGGSLDLFDRWASACGLAQADNGTLEAPGDILLCSVGAQQFHVMIDGGDGLVHAHVGLGRVVVWPKPSPWPVLRRWRLAEG